MSASFSRFRFTAWHDGGCRALRPSVTHPPRAAPPVFRPAAEVPRHHCDDPETHPCRGSFPARLELPRRHRDGGDVRSGQARRSTRESTGSVGKSVMSELTGQLVGVGPGGDPVLAQDQREGEHRLDHREVLADAGPRTAAERHPRVAVRRLGARAAGEARRVEHQRVLPELGVAVDRPRRDDDVGAGRHAVAHQVVLLDGEPAQDRGRGVEPHGLLEHRRRQRQRR